MESCNTMQGVIRYSSQIFAPLFNYIEFYVVAFELCLLFHLFIFLFLFQLHTLKMIAFLVRNAKEITVRFISNN